MARIVILDFDGERRDELVESVRRATGSVPVIAEDETWLISRVRLGSYAAVFADADLLGDQAATLINAVRTAPVRPMLILASTQKPEDLDPELVTLILRKPYDVPTLTGILLAAVTQVPHGIAPHGQAASRPSE